MAIKNVIFDFDGTIADTGDLIIRSWQYTYEARRGEKGDEDVIRKSFGEPLVLTMEREFPEFDVQESIEIYRSYQFKHYKEEVSSFPGMVEVIKRLKERGYTVSVVTSRMRSTTLAGLEKFGILEDMSHVITCEDTSEHKPNPAPVIACLNALGAEPDTAIMVGDSTFDIRCCHGAGVKGVLVGWSHLSEEEKRESGADFIIDKAEDLLNIL